jgi:hypothetical protein
LRNALSPEAGLVSNKSGLAHSRALPARTLLSGLAGILRNRRILVCTCVFNLVVVGHNLTCVFSNCYLFL